MRLKPVLQMIYDRIGFLAVMCSFLIAIIIYLKLKNQFFTFIFVAGFIIFNVCIYKSYKTVFLNRKHK